MPFSTMMEEESALWKISRSDDVTWTSGPIIYTGSFTEAEIKEMFAFFSCKTGTNFVTSILIKDSYFRWNCMKIQGHSHLFLLLKTAWVYRNLDKTVTTNKPFIGRTKSYAWPEIKNKTSLTFNILWIHYFVSNHLNVFKALKVYRWTLYPSTQHVQV